MAVCIVVSVVSCWRSDSESTVSETNTLTVFNWLLAALGMMLLMAFLLLAWFSGWYAQSSFPVAERYFVFLMPFAVLLSLWGLQVLLNVTKNDVVLKFSVVAGFAVMVVFNAAWTYIHLMTWGPFWSV
jgi:hypothetical protein